MIPNKTNLRKWVAALRSGEFKQGYGRLKHFYSDGLRYCCLGVACELAVRDGVDIAETVKGSNIYFGASHGSLDFPVMEWLGVSHGSPVIQSGELGLVTAINANDGNSWSFNQIAKAIEEFYGLLQDDADAPATH